MLLNLYQKQKMSFQKLEYLTCVQQQIADDEYATDLVWSLFVAALQTYRFDSVLRPFPPSFIGADGEKDIKLLELVVSLMPALKEITANRVDLDSQAAELLKWVIHKKNFDIKTLHNSEYENIKKMTGETVEITPPDFIFEIIPSEAALSRFEELRKNRKTMFAYHGSRLENFHSILHNGLASHMNKTSVFGEGTYLSSELSVSIHYSQIGLGWEKSLIGERLSCVAVCEMIDDTSVKRKYKTDEDGGGRSRAGNSMAGDVPEKYYIVQNNEMLRVKYLMIYVEKSRGSQRLKRRNRMSWWIYRHRFEIMVVFYVILLLFVGLANSKSFIYHFNRFWKYKWI